MYDCHNNRIFMSMQHVRVLICYIITVNASVGNPALNLVSMGLNRCLLNKYTYD